MTNPATLGIDQTAVSQWGDDSYQVDTALRAQVKGARRRLLRGLGDGLPELQ